MDAVPYDGLVMAAVARELNELIKGGRIDRVHQPSESALVLSIYRHPGKFRLLLSAHARHARIHLTGHTQPNPPTPPLFCLLLRKHLEGSRIREIRQRGLERVLEIEVDTYDELGSPVSKTLYCEVMGKHSNLILVDDRTNLIIDGIRRYSHALSRYREVLPGRPYIPPPVQDKLEPEAAGEEEFYTVCMARPLETPLAALLQQVVNGLSLLTARELVHRAGLVPEPALDSCGEFELRSLWGTVQNLAADIETGNYSPSIQIGKDGLICDYAAVSLTHCPARPAGPAMNDVVDQYFQNREEQDFLEKEKTSLRRVVVKARERAVQKISRAGDDEDRGDTYRLYGELLTANLYRLTKGETAVVIEDYHSGQPQEVPLDPTLTPAENAQRYFRLYTRLRGAARTATAVRETATEEKEYLEGIENALGDAAGRDELEEVRSELSHQGYLREDVPRPRAKGAPHPLELKSADGVAICIGRNNLQNDYLTLHLAAPNDVWLHARGFPGAHVVIRAAGRPVPETTLQEAARLAAGFSRGRNDSSVPVDYTRIKYVKKPRGAKPGLVIYEREKTIHVAPKRPGDNL
ncbi:MAG TPA: NFACT RNA binding domain-containing protein [Spirochaetia bacterium]|nr:NFACT RNA binding domain-containing protein [Spirochaetia bacterium]